MSSFTPINTNEPAAPQQLQQPPAQRPQPSVLSIDDDDKPAAAIPSPSINNGAYSHLMDDDNDHPQFQLFPTITTPSHTVSTPAHQH